MQSILESELTERDPTQIESSNPTESLPLVDPDENAMPAENSQALEGYFHLDESC